MLQCNPKSDLAYGVDSVASLDKNEQQTNGGDLIQICLSEALQADQRRVGQWDPLSCSTT